MATLTQNMIQELNTVDFLTAEQAAALANKRLLITQNVAMLQRLLIRLFGI